MILNKLSKDSAVITVEELICMLNKVEDKSIPIEIECDFTTEEVLSCHEYKKDDRNVFIISEYC